MRGAGDQRRRGRGAEALAAAVAARESASNAFYEMDQAQKYVTGRVTVFADLDSTAADPSQQEFGRLTEAADTASAHYIAVLDAHDLDNTERTPAEYDAARRALLAVTDGLTKITNDLNGFAGRLAPKMARLEAALDQLPPRLGAAREAVAAAEAAIAAARAAGMDAEDPEAELAGARAALGVLTSQGLGGLGLAGALDQADEVRKLADRAREQAEELPKQAEKVRHALTAVRTRVQVVAGRIDAVEAAMSRLLRGYSQACWQDLKGAPASIEEALVRARERIAESDAFASRGEWKPAQRALTAARTELSAADRRAGQVTGRLADLDAAKADPAKPAEAARFVVRDAQKLVVNAGNSISPQHAKTLDALVARLETSRQRLNGAHPDYWAYLQELEAIKAGARDVIERVRAERVTDR